MDTLLIILGITVVTFALSVTILFRKKNDNSWGFTAVTWCLVVIYAFFLGQGIGIEKACEVVMQEADKNPGSPEVWSIASGINLNTIGGIGGKAQERLQKYVAKGAKSFDDVKELRRD